MNDYELKQEARRERYERKAEQLRAEAIRLHDQAHDMASVIPFGQPILVGHYSEGRDRRYRERIHNTFGKAFATMDKADYYAQKAASVGTGGMYSKLLSAHRVAQLGVPTAILPGCEPDVIPRLFAGETIGTWVRPEQRTVSRRKYWLAYQADPQGTLYLDTGAADAVRNHGKSLLPGGITEVHGSFEAGALVRLVYDRETVGVGLSNYNAADLLRIRGLKRHEVAAILGDAHYPEVVHRDNLLLDAAL